MQEKSSLYVHRPSLYNFLRFANRYEIEKSILDCGAGGKVPPLELFARYGYDATGIDIDQDQINRATEFASSHNLSMKIEYGDMRDLKFPDASFGFVYSVNSIFHLPKADSAKAMAEMRRVLKPGGLLYVNFLSIDDQNYGKGKEVNPGEFLQEEHGGTVIHSYYKDHEPDTYFDGMDLIFYQKRMMRLLFKEGTYSPCMFDYIAKKKE